MGVKKLIIDKSGALFLEGETVDNLELSNDHMYLWDLQEQLKKNNILINNKAINI